MLARFCHGTAREPVEKVEDLGPNAGKRLLLY